MANEAIQIPKPNTIPSAVSTGYTRQNVEIEASYFGQDESSIVSASATQVKFEDGGKVDVNGILYTMTTDATLTLSAADTDYYIYLAGPTISGYLTNIASPPLAVGSVSIPVDTGSGTISTNDYIQFAGDSNIYQHTGSAITGSGTITIASPGLLQALGDGVAVTVTPSTLTPTITTSTGTFDSTKGGFYLSGERVLDWKVRRNSTSVYSIGKRSKKNASTFVDQNLTKDSNVEHATLVINNTSINTGTSDGTDNKNITVSSAGAIGITRGGYLDMKGNESATAPGSILLVPGNTTTSFTRIYAEDGGTDTLAFQIDNTTGIQNNLPLKPTTTPTNNSQSVAGGGGTFTLPRGWHIVCFTTANFQLQVNRLGGTSTIPLGVHGIQTDGTDVVIINNNAGSASFAYNTY